MYESKIIEMTHQRNTHLIEASYLLLIAFSMAFFSRFLEFLGAPALINFVHLAAVPVACGIAIAYAKNLQRAQRNTCYSLLLGLLLFTAIDLASAVFNNAGLINVFFDTFLLVEPFVLLAAIASLPITLRTLTRLRTWFEGFLLFHLLLIYIQKFLLNYCAKPGDCDNVQGVFYHSGSGHVVGASVSATFAIYYFAIAKSRPLWVRSLVLIAGLGNIFTSDAKQVLLTLIVAFALIVLTKRDPVKSAVYLIGFVLFMAVFLWAIQNIEALGAFSTWIRPEIYGPEGEATKLKLSGIRITLSHFTTPFNWIIGLGPGHTIDRLGGWMLRDYSDLLDPLGATRTTIGQETWDYVASSWLAEGSSMFAPFWGWAAIWGDLGILGLIAYLFLGIVVWQKLCLDDVSRFLVFTAIIHGFIFTQLEEPAYMLSLAMVIGIRWHEQKLSQQNTPSAKLNIIGKRRMGKRRTLDLAENSPENFSNNFQNN
jgi:hypothetical protein